VKLPSDLDVPVYVKDEFGDFYKAMFSEQVKKQDMRAVFTEYAWDMGWCDPCASEPLSNKELVELGARWIGDSDDTPYRRRAMSGADAYVTRLHVRYDARTFPEDIVFMETKDRSNFQGRYVQHHPWQGKASCDRADTYRKTLPGRFAREAKNLEDLTGWARGDIEGRMAITGQPLRAK
jgi:hypothetical protein